MILRACDAERAAGQSLGALGCLVALAVPLVVLAAPQSNVVAVVGAPSDRLPYLAQVVAEAGGAILGAGGRDNVVLARSDHPGFAGRLYAAGARLVLDADHAPGCGRPVARAIPANAFPDTIGSPLS